MTSDEGRTIAPAVHRVVQVVRGRADELVPALALRIAERESAFRPGVLLTADEVAAMCRQALVSAAALLADDGATALAQVREGARRRARQGVPVTAALHALRIGGQFVWTAVTAAETRRTVLVDASDRVWSVVDVLSQTVTEEYERLDPHRARPGSRARAEALRALFHGEPGCSPGTAAELRLPLDGTFVVVTGAAEQDRSPLCGLEDRLLSRGVVSAWLRGGEAEHGLVVLGPRFDLGQLCQEIADRATTPVGVSEVFHGLDGVRAALAEASIARSAGRPGSADVVRHDQALVPLLIASAPAAARRLANAVLGRILSLPPRECETLLSTLRAWLDQGGSPAAAAKRLHCHRNTVGYRLHRVAELTDRSLARPADVAQLHLSLDVVEVLGLQPSGRSR